LLSQSVHPVETASNEKVTARRIRVTFLFLKANLVYFVSNPLEFQRLIGQLPTEASRTAFAKQVQKHFSKGEKQRRKL